MTITRMIVVALAVAAAEQASHGAAAVLGTWTGTSLCVGDRPACKNEEVVYRFRSVVNQPRQVTLLADKIIDGKRVPMGALEFIVSDDGTTITGEFRVRQTHGLWEFTVSGDTMDGTLVILPDRSLARRVHVRRVAEDQVPAAPGFDEYGP